MIIRSVRLHNIRSYLDQTVEFPEGSVMLGGDIGSGKSSILLAIEFALFGVMRGVLDGNALLRHGKATGFVELNFAVDGKEVVVRRELKQAGKGVSQDSGYLIIDGRKVAATPVELKAKVLGLLGYPAQLLTKSKELIYRFTVYTPQEEMKRILFEDAPLRLDTLRSVFQIDKYRRIRENALVVLQEMRARERELNARIEDLDEKQKKLLGLEECLTKASATVSELQPKLAEKERIIAGMKEEVRVIESRIRDFNDLKRQLDVLGAKHYEKCSLRKSVGDDLQMAEKRVAELEAKLKTIDRMEEEELVMQLEVAEMALEEISRVISQHEFVRADSEKKKLKLGSIDECPTCFQNVPKEHKQNIFRLEDERISKAIGIVEQKLGEKKLTQEKLAGLRDLQKRLIGLKHLAAQLNDWQEQKGVLQEKQKALEKEISDIASGKMLLEGKAEAFGDIDEKCLQKKKELEQLLVSEKELLVKKAQFEKEKENLALNISALEKELKQKLEAKEKLNSIRQHHRWLEDFFLNLVVDIEKHVMVSVNQAFNDFFRQWFNTLMEDEAISARIDETFSPVIEQNGYETDVTNLSGGEKTSCALAYRLALNKVINDMITNIKTRDLIILDEPTDGFSTEQLEKVRDVINELNAKQLIIVSHEPKVESFVDKVIRVVKQEHISRVV